MNIVSFCVVLQISFSLVPVKTIESLPLRQRVREMEGAVLLSGIEKVTSGSQMSSRQKKVVVILDVLKTLFRQPQKVINCTSLHCLCEQGVDVANSEKS